MQRQGGCLVLLEQRCCLGGLLIGCVKDQVTWFQSTQFAKEEHCSFASWLVGSPPMSNAAFAQDAESVEQALTRHVGKDIQHYVHVCLRNGRSFKTHQHYALPAPSLEHLDLVLLDLSEH